MRSNNSRAGYADFVFAFHDGEEIGPKMLSRIADLENPGESRWRYQT